MSAMLHLAHGAVRMGQFGRKVLTASSINLRDLTPGQYIIYGRFGDGEVSAVPAISNGPISTTNGWSPSLGYTMFVDVENIAMGGDYMGSPAMNAVTGGATRRMEVTMMVHAIAGDSRYTGTAAQQAEMTRRMGLMKWETYYQVVSTSAGNVAGDWAYWVGLTPNTAATGSVAARVRGSNYAIELSITNNWYIDDYNPTLPLIIGYASFAGRGMAKYDGVATITLNSIASTGAVVFGGENGAAPKWLNEYTPTSGKKGRIILDYSGSLVTAMGIDLSGDTTVY